MLRDSKSISFCQQNRQPLPFLQHKKIGAQFYVSERVSRMRKQKAKQKNSIDQQANVKWKQVDQIKQLKKNFLLSSNKVVSSQQILSTFQPFRKELQVLRKKPSATINYQQIISNLHPFSNAIRQLQIRERISESKNLIKSSENCPASLKLYRSIPKRKSQKHNHNLKSIDDKPMSQSRIKSQDVYFLNVGKINLLDSQEKKNKKIQDVGRSSFIQNRASSYSLDQSQSQKEKQKSKTIQQSREKREVFRSNFSRLKLISQQQQMSSALQRQKSILPRIHSTNEQQNQKTRTLDPRQQLQNIKKQVPFRAKKKKKITNIPFQTYYYRSMLWKVNLSNHLNIQTPQQYQHRLRVFVGKGNNSGLVRGLVKRRIWFAITDKIQEANFVWTQLKSLPYFKLQQACTTIQPKTQSQPNLEHYYSHSSFVTKNDQKQYIKYIESYYQSQQRSDERLVPRTKYFNGKFKKSIKSSQIKLTKMQNHLINNYVIGNKKALFNTMSCYYTQINQQVFDYLPLTFHIKNGLQDQSYFKFLKYYYNRAKQIKSAPNTSSLHKCKNIWIVKPGQNSNRGNGINVCLNLQEIKAILKKKQMYNDGTYRTYIVQIYIEKPLLYNKRKFDLRHYMMITCVNGVVKGYWYKQGYVRTTSTQYSLGSNSSMIHLTNDAVQKNLPDYGKFQKGNKLSYEQLQNYILKLTSKRKQPIIFRQHILPKMKKIATDAIRACSGGIDPQRKQNNFQIFGLDFMIDADYKLYLIEINSNPCLQLSCPILGSIIPKMVQNTLQMTLDTLFPPPIRYTPKGLHYYKNLEQQNRYQLVYDSRYEKLYQCSMTVLDNKLLQEEDDTFQDDGQEFDPQD